jgi:flagellar hook-associated protein 1
MITAFAIGNSALDTAQTALNVIGQNIANATTPGYNDQSVNLVNTVSGTTGIGVDVATINNATDAPVQTAIYATNSAQASSSAQLSISQQVQSALNTGSDGIADQLNSFFNQIDELTSDPNSTAQQQQLVSTASTLASQLNSASDSIDQLQSSTYTQIQQGISQVNSLATQIASLNDQIASAEAQGQQPNDLIDQQGEAINSLSQLMDIQTVNQPNGVVNVLGESGSIVVGPLANSFQVTTNTSGNVVITQSNAPTPVTIGSGSLGGQIQAYNTTTPAVSAQLDTFASQLAQQVNEIQATGLSASGPLTSVTGSIAASSATAPLDQAGLPFPVQAGQLTVSVTDSAGNRTNSTINIDPTTDSVQSIAADLNGITGLQASVNSDNQLVIQAQSGYSFDFAGRDTNPPTNSAVSNPDTAGVLSALGINGFFTGSTAESIAVSPTLQANPGLVATSTTGEPGDSTNLQKLSALQSEPLINGQTLSNNIATVAASVGNDVENLTDQQTAQSGVLQNLTNEDSSVTGVDTNNEFINLLSYQKMIQGASEYITTVNTALDSIFNIIQPE